MIGRLTLGALFLTAVPSCSSHGSGGLEGGGMWGAMFFISLFLCVIPFTLYAYAGQLIPSSLSSIYNASTPVVTMLVGLAVLPDERLTKGRLVGLLDRKSTRLNSSHVATSYAVF